MARGTEFASCGYFLRRNKIGNGKLGHRNRMELYRQWSAPYKGAWVYSNDANKGSIEGGWLYPFNNFKKNMKK